METLRTIAPLSKNSAAALGYFDGVHLGHLAVIGAALNKARERTLAPAVLSFDMSSRRARGKGARDLITIAERIRLIEQTGAESLLLPDFSLIADLDCESFVDEILGEGCLSAKYVCCGADFRFGRGREGGAEELRALCEARGIELEIIKEVSAAGGPVSTTRIKEAAAAGDMELAAALLGRPYGLMLEVVKGKRLARRLGFPTINQPFPEDITRPRFGVYASRAVLEGRSYGAISNLGVRPTVRENGAAALETHIFGFEGEAYGESVLVELLSFMRDERRFESDGELKKQVLADCEKAKELLGLI